MPRFRDGFLPPGSSPGVLCLCSHPLFYSLSVKSFSLSRSFLTFSLAFIASATTALGCSVCGCSLSDDWAAQGYTMMPGFELGLRFDYADQTELRAGTDRADRATLTFPNDAEIQQRTLNRGTVLDLNYVINPRWAVSATLPYDDRFHSTVTEGDTDISTSHANGLGDVRLLTRYQTFNVAHSFGFQFGLKLPTGHFDQNFATGPQAGELLDRGLQLGTGTTDLLLGVSEFMRPTENVGCFIQAMLDQPLTARAGFIPSMTLQLNSGVRWLNPSRFTPQLQLNLKAETREHGPKADTANSGGTFAYLSPGVTAEVTSRTHAFAFVQLPVYQRVNGLQLHPRWSVSIGCRWKI